MTTSNDLLKAWLTANGYVVPTVPDNLSDYTQSEIKDYAQVTTHILEGLIGERERTDLFIFNDILYERKKSEPHSYFSLNMEPNPAVDSFHMAFEFRKHEDRAKELLDLLKQAQSPNFHTLRDKFFFRQSQVKEYLRRRSS